MTEDDWKTAKPLPESQDEAIERLTALPEIEYERVRKEEAKKLSVRTAVLDKQIKAARSNGADENDLGLFGPDPWPEEVDGDDLLDQIVKAICRYVVMPPHTAEAAVLWVLHTHCFDIGQITPRLAIASPEKGCGKSTLLDVLALLVPRALKAENLSAAVMFRVIENHRPCLLVDEVDTFLRDNEELRGILNSGHRKGGRVLRCEGDENAVKAFNTFAPVATCGIGRLPGTLEDRSIPIILHKRKASEPVSNFRSDRAKHLYDLASQAARWTTDNRSKLRDHEPDLPDGLFNRLADNWRPLIAIADVAGGEWPDIARTAAQALSDPGDDDSESIRVRLLADIQTIFNETGADRLLSAVLAEHLHGMEDRPWPEYGRSNKPITPTQIARQLRAFKISPNTIRTDASRGKGYERAKLEETFIRYLPPSQSVTAGQVNVEAGLSPIPKRDNENGVTLWETPKPTADKGCHAVTARKGGEGQNNVSGACIHCHQSVNGDPAAVPAEGNGWLHSGCYDQYFGFRQE
jgi:putative DNA primase/helicase